MSAPSVTIRSPSHVGNPPPTTARPPPINFLTGTWHVTHSTLPMWKSNRNVRITYKPLPGSGPYAALDDLVEYQGLHSDKLKTVSGVDNATASKAAAEKKPEEGELRQTIAGLEGEWASNWSWKWRGNGWLKFVTSEWEVLGYGEEGKQESERDWYDAGLWTKNADATAAANGVDATGKRWAVTYFAKTLFTPAGIDIYSRDPSGLKPETIEAIKSALTQHAALKDLAGKLFEVQSDKK